VKRALFDLEGNGLLHATETAPRITRVHCIAGVDIDTGEAWDYGPDQIPAAVEHLSTYDQLWAQNGLRYDFPVLEEFHGFVVPFERKRDLMIASRLKHPNIKETDAANNVSRRRANKPPIPPQYFGAHTVGAWGCRLGAPKLHEGIEDWSQWTPDMHERCIGDVATSLKWWKYINPDKMSQKALELEHWIAHVCEEMTQAGWPFDEKAAAELHIKIMQRRDEIERELKQTFGGWFKRGKLFTPARDNTKLGYVEGAQCTKIEWVSFNPKSRPHIERCLRKLGWVPTEFTDNGAAKTDEEILENVAQIYSEAGELVEYLMLNKRLGQLHSGDQAWLKKVKAGKIHAAYNPMGTITSRAAHFQPNIGQVPAASVQFGPECRALFGVLPGFGQCGADMEGLELRVLAHYMAKYDGGEFGRTVLEGDPHWDNVLGFGFYPKGTKRDKHDELHTVFRETGAKRGVYAVLYGCGAEKLGMIILEALRLAMKRDPLRAAPIYARYFGTDMAPGKRKITAVGKEAKESFLANLPALRQLYKIVGSLADTQGWVPGLDGRRVPCRSAHSAVNALVQSAGAILCKNWVVNSYRACLRDGLTWGWDGDFVFLGWIHDEIQAAFRDGLGDRLGELLTAEARRAGEPYGFRIRLDSKYKLGRNWADTH
jgi:DNA polymerase-1